MFKRAYLAAAAAATILLSGPVMAADIVEEPIPTWTGFYIGAGAGFAWLDLSADSKFCDADGDCFHDDNLDQLFENIDGDNAFRGVIQAGFDWEMSPGILIGIMGDFNFGEQIGIDEEVRFDVGADELHSKFEYGMDSMWTLAGRIGWATENALFYGLVGWTWADTDVKVRHGCFEDECITRFDGGEWLDGWTLGGGVEFKGFLFEGASTRLEYRYTDLGGVSANGRDEFGNSFEASADQTVQGVYLTFNWRFDPFM